MFNERRMYKGFNAANSPQLFHYVHFSKRFHSQVGPHSTPDQIRVGEHAGFVSVIVCLCLQGQRYFSSPLTLRFFFGILLNSRSPSLSNRTSTLYNGISNDDHESIQLVCDLKTQLLPSDLMTIEIVPEGWEKKVSANRKT